MADVITTAFIIRQRRLLSTHRYLAVGGVPHKVRQSGSIHPGVCHCVPPLLGVQLLHLSVVPERHFLSLFMLSGFLIFRGWRGGQVFFAVSFHGSTQSALPPSGLLSLPWVSLQASVTLVCVHGIRGMGGFSREVTGLFLSVPAGLQLPLRCDPYSPVYSAHSGLDSEQTEGRGRGVP